MQKIERSETVEEKKQGLNVSVKSFLTAIAVILILMVLSYAMTFVIPGGEYARMVDEAGNTVIDAAGGFSYVAGGLPLWKWLLSPVLVLGADGGGMVAAILAFLLVVGGVFNALETCGLMKYMLDKLVFRFGKARYSLLAVVTFFFMAMGSFIGSFEECVPLVPIVSALAVNLGWDVMTGLGMSLLAAGCGFAAGVCNPFTVGVAQSLAGLPMFSGVWLRGVGFVLIYALLMAFLRSHAGKVDRGEGFLRDTFAADRKMDAGLKRFGVILGLGILLVLSSGVITVLQDYTMIIVAVMFLVGGIAAALACGMRGKELLRAFGKGMVTILPAVLLILMAGSIKYTLTEAKILDTVLYWAVRGMDGLPKWGVILFIYLIVLGMNFFISSGSAKAFLLMPLIIPMAQIFGIEKQLCVMAFAFGDGFSNVFYPTNAALLIALGLADVSYTDWVKFSWKFQGLNLVLTSGLLLAGLVMGYR